MRFLSFVTRSKLKSHTVSMEYLRNSSSSATPGRLESRTPARSKFEVPNLINYYRFQCPLHFSRLSRPVFSNAHLKTYCDHPREQLYCVAQQFKINCIISAITRLVDSRVLTQLNVSGQAEQTAVKCCFRG
jgi:hypothetical protein